MMKRAGMSAFWLITILTLSLSLGGAPVAVADEDGERAAVLAGADKEATSEEGNAAEAESAEGEQIKPDAFKADERSGFGGFRIWGDLQVAYRSIDLDGSETRFRKDYGLDDGLRVLDSSITLVPDGPEPAGWFDRIELFGDGLGGDRYETWGLRANKAGSYRLNFRTRKVDYFWAMTGDPHSWDMQRRNTDGDLTINLTSNLELTGTYRGFRQTNNRLSTRYYSGDVFEFNEPLDQTGSTWGAGLRWRIGSTLLFLNQDFHKFNDNGGFGSRGLNSGLGGSEAVLTFLEQREVREMKAPTTRGGFVTSIGDGRFRVSGDIVYSKQELDFDFTNAFEGEDFRQRSVEGGVEGLGDVTRKIKHGNLRLLWNASERLNLFGQYRRRGWDQSGQRNAVATLDFTDSDTTVTDLDLTLSDYEVTIDQFIFGAEWALARSATLFGEFGTGTRRQSYGTDGVLDEDSETEATSYKVGGRFRAGRGFDGEASYERGDIDNPLTRLAPSKADAVKVKLRARPGTAWVISANYTLWDTQNDTGDPRLTSSDPVTLRTENWGVNVSFNGNHQRGRFVYVGYTRLNYESNVPIRFVAFTFDNFVEGRAEYESTDDIWSVGAEYLVSDATALTLYGRVNYVDSSGTVPLTYYDTAIGARYVLRMGLFLDAQGRFVKYEDNTELPSNVDNYTGTIFTLGLGYRF